MIKALGITIAVSALAITTFYICCCSTFFTFIHKLKRSEEED